MVKVRITFFFICFLFCGLPIELSVASDGGCKAFLGSSRNDSSFLPVSADDFFSVVSELQNMPFLRRRSLEEYQNIVAEDGRLYLLNNRNVGYGIKSNGLLISVFNESGEKGFGALAVIDAIQNGATSLLCADGPLQSYYESFGFRVVERMPMSPENAGYHLDWPNDLRPEMLLMILED